MPRKRVNPIKYITPKGDEVLLFTMEQMCRMIGRERNQVFKWECSGILPKTYFVHKNNFGVTCRLYSAEQIEVIKKELIECQVMSGRRTPDKFKRHLHKEFKRLAIKYGLLEEGGGSIEKAAITGKKSVK